MMNEATAEFATMAPLTMSEAVRLYKAQNDAGCGYALGDDEATISDAADGAGDIVLRARTTSDVYVVRPNAGLYLVLVGGDAMGCEPWAVDVTADMLVVLRSA